MGTNSMWGYPAKLSTDNSGNTVLVGADTEILLLNSSIMSVRVASQALPWFVATLLDLSSIVLDTHGKVDLVNNVIENPFYGVSDCYIRGAVVLSVTGAGTYRQVEYAAGATTGLGTTLKSEIFQCSLSDAVVNSTLPVTLLSSAHRYVGVKAAHDIAATANGTASIELEFFA